MGRTEKSFDLITASEGRAIGEKIGRGRPLGLGALGATLDGRMEETLIERRRSLLRPCHGRNPQDTVRALRKLYRECCGVRLPRVEEGTCPCERCTLARSVGWWDGAARILPEDVTENRPAIVLPDTLMEPMPQITALATAVEEEA